MSTISASPLSLQHPAVRGAIKRADIDPTGMTDAELRSALMASIATDVAEPVDQPTFLERLEDKLDQALFGTAIIKILGSAVATGLVVLWIAQTFIANS